MIDIERRRILSALATATGSALAGCAAPRTDEATDREGDDEPEEPESLEELATQFVRALAAERFERAEELTATLGAGSVSAGELEHVWLGHAAVGGEFERVLETTERDVDEVDPELRAALEPTLGGRLDEVDVIDVRMGFENGEHSLRLLVEDLTVVVPVFNDEYDRPSYVDPDAFDERNATVSADGCDLEGVVAAPTEADEGDVPGVVLVHGSGPADMDLDYGATKMYRDLAEGLASRGVATLRYHKRTFSCPVGTDEHTLDRVTVDDALEAIETLRDVEGVDPDRIVVVGHSMGGMAVPRIVDRDGLLAGAVAMAAPGRPLYELFVEQYDHLTSVTDHEWPIVEQQYERARRDVERVRDGEFRTDEIVLEYPGALWASLEAYDHLETARDVDVPLLYLQGDRDYQVSPEDDFERIREELGDRPETRFESYDGLNHAFMPGEGPSVTYEYYVRNTVDERVVEDVATWIDDL